MKGSNEIQRSNIAIPIRELIEVGSHLVRIRITNVCEPSLADPLQIKFEKVTIKPASSSWFEANFRKTVKEPVRASGGP